MRRIDDRFETRDGVHLARTVWDPADGDGGRANGGRRGGAGDSGARDGGPRAAVLLIHGMAEHRERYAALGETLAGRGFLVWAYDQRGHGETAMDPESRRHIAPANDWTRLVEDAEELLSNLARALSDPGAAAGGGEGGGGEGAGKQAPEAGGTPVARRPLFALGHSMGSLVLRDALTDPPSPPCGAILMGTAGSGGLKAVVGRALAAIVAAFKAPSAPSQLLNDLTFGPYNATIADAQTEFDWLSRDREEVGRYIEDPHCGEIMSAHFYRELARGIMRVSSRSAIEGVPNETSVLLLSGTEDPVGGSGRGVREVTERLERAGHPDVELRLKAGARHELLHEINRHEVVGEIAEWLDHRVATCQNGHHQQE